MDTNNEMEIVYWAPRDKVERIYFNIPRQDIVVAWLEPIEPSKDYPWDHRFIVMTNAFVYQPEIRKQLVHSVRAYAMHQLEDRLEAAGFPRRWQDITWPFMLEMKPHLGVVRTSRPKLKKAAAGAAVLSL